MVVDGTELFIAYFKKMAREYPGKKVAFKLAIAETLLRFRLLQYLVCETLIFPWYVKQGNYLILLLDRDEILNCNP